MTVRAATKTIPYGCPACAMGNHRACTATEERACKCATRDHDPDVETAAAMCAYRRPDLVSLPVEQRASHWRRVTRGGSR